jgi:hypothetical protein
VEKSLDGFSRIGKLCIPARRYVQAHESQTNLSLELKRATMSSVSGFEDVMPDVGSNVEIDANVRKCT